MTSGMALLGRIDRKEVKADALAGELSKLPGAPCRPPPRTRYNIACDLSRTNPKGSKASKASQETSIRASLELLGNDSAREGRPWAVEDPVLRDLRTGQHGPAFRAAVRRGAVSGGPGARPLSRLDAIGVTGAEQLARAGIYSARDLLREAGPKAARDRLAKFTGRDTGLLRDWALLGEVAELVYFKDTAADGDDTERRHRALDIANVLALAGYGSVQAVIDATSADPPPLVPPKSTPKGQGKPRGDKVEPTPPRPAPNGVKVELLARRLTSTNADEAVIATIGKGKLFEFPEPAVLAWVNAAFAMPKSTVDPDGPAPPLGGASAKSGDKASDAGADEGGEPDPGT